MKPRIRLCPLLAFALFFGGCRPQGHGQMANKTQETRRPAVAGAFYAGNPDRLRATVKRFLDKVPDVKPAGEILAALAPHAGYRFSGQVAAYSHKLLGDVDFDTAVIIGHDSHAPGVVAFICPVDYFETPLGSVPVDTQMAAKMLKFHRGIRADRSIHAREHTVEVQLPFLQFFGRKCEIIPILFGDPTVEHCRILADAILSAAGGKKVLVLASTDLSHYPSYEHAQEVDNSTLETLRSLDVRKLYAHLKTEESKRSIPGLRTAMCARGGVGTAMFFAEARGADHVQILRCANSGDVPAGDRHRVVGYCSVLIVKKATQE